MEDKLQSKVSKFLEEAEQSARQGERQKAYQSSLEATNLAPGAAQAWYARSQTAPSTEEQLMCLSRAFSLDPAFPNAKRELHAAVRRLLTQESFLAYVHETEVLYQVRSGLDLLINIPKNRVFEEPYLQRPPGLLRPVFISLYLSVLALLIGGVGAFVLAPITIIHALRYRPLTRAKSDRARIRVVLIISFFIWLASIPIGFLLLMRFFS
jgi:hypothetical protein